MKPASPVIVGLEPYETVYGRAEAGQPEYMPLPSLRSPDGVVMSRWELTPEERSALACGADLLLVLRCNGNYPPTQIRVVSKSDDLESVKTELRLDDALALRVLHEDLQKARQALEAKISEVYNTPQTQAGAQ